VGVVIPTYNRVDETRRAVISVFAQTVIPQQVVVVDDGSTGDVFENLLTALDGLPVEVFQIDHTAHPGRVRNAALARLRTSHVAFLDSDDTWFEGKIERQLDMVSRGHSAIFSNASIAGRGPQSLLVPAGAFSGEVRLKGLLAQNVICNSSVLLSRRLLDMIGGIPASYAVRGIEDYAAWLRVASICSWQGIAEPLVEYRDAPDVSIRSTKDCRVPEHLLAQLDYLAWRSEIGKPLKWAEHAAYRGLPWLLRHSTRKWRPDRRSFISSRATPPA
jgi:glycosyltransferase involved in cell wall biosynthesis